MRGFRAKGADRDRYVEVIESAYVDGQIGDADRELRVSRALSAKTLDELETLTRDLQNRPIPAQAAPPPRTPRTGRVAGLVAALGAFVVLVGGGVVGLVVLSATDESGVGSPTVVVSSEAVPVPSEAGAAQARSFAMTAPEVRRFLKGYEKRFGTLDVFEVGFYPTRVGAQVPVRGTRPRMERWSFDGTWRRDTKAARVREGTVVFDAGELDVQRLFANITTARKTLGVQRGRLTHVLIHTWTDGVPTVNIYIANSFDESGFLKTSMAGDLIRAFPYDA